MSGEAGEGYHDNRSTAAASSCHAQIGPSSVAVTHSVAMLIDKFQFKSYSNTNISGERITFSVVELLLAKCFDVLHTQRCSK